MIRITLLFCFLLGGCTYQYAVESIPVWSERLELSERHSIRMARGFSLASESTICVHNPRVQTPVETNAVVSKQVAAALQPFFSGVYLTSQSPDKQASLSLSKRLGCGFLLFPQIAVAQDEQSSVSELFEGVDSLEDVGFDRLYLMLALWDVESDKLIDVSYLESRTPFFKIADNEPLDLLNGALDVYLKQIVAFHL